MSRTEKRHPERFPSVRREYLGDNKKELKAYLQGKLEYRDGFVTARDGVTKVPKYLKVRKTNQIV